MNNKIPITLVNLPTIPIQNELDFAENSNLLETIQNIKKGGTWSVKDILKYIVPVLISNKILDLNNPIIHLHISGDKCNISRKIKYIMITMTILNNKKNIYKPDHYVFS